MVEKHNGKVLQYTGDGTLCTFGSAIEAVNCAVEIQKALKNEAEINLRIGIHVGDIVFEGDNIYGDGVNVASRIEPLAEPGGVCVSNQVYENIKNHPAIEANYLGEKTLKNVDHPTKIYCLIGEGLPISKPFTAELVSETVETKTPLKKLLPWTIGIAVLLIFFFAKGWFAGESSITEVRADENSLAVVYFENLAEPEDSQRHAEMVKELLTIDLSQAQGMRVISSQRLYDIAKQQRRDKRNVIDRSNATSVAREAGARWMLTGTLSQVGSHMVLASQLVNVRDGKVVNAQRVDGTDLFTLIDLLSVQVRDNLGVTAAPGEVDAPIMEQTTGSTEAYRHYLAGVDLLNDSQFDSAIVSLRKAVSIDTAFNQAYYKMAIAQWWAAGEGAIEEEAKHSLAHILASSRSISAKQRLMAKGLSSLISSNYHDAESIYEQLLKEHPDEKEGWYGLGEAYYHGVKNNLKALNAFERAIELDPEFRLGYTHIFDIYIGEKLYDRGIQVANRFIALYPEKVSGYKYLVTLYIRSGQYDLAQAEIKSIEEGSPQALAKDEYQKFFEDVGWAYLYNGNFKTSEKYFRKAFAIDPETKNAMIFNGLGWSLLKQGNYTEAEEFLLRGLALAPEHVGIFNGLKTLNQTRKDYEKAIQYAHKMFEFSPNPSGYTYGDLAETYIGASRFHEADSVMQVGLSTLTSTKEKQDLLANMAWAYFYNENSKTSEKYFRKAFAIDPETKNAYMFSGLGWSLIPQEKYSEAEKYFLEGLAITPNYFSILNGMSVLYLSRGDYDGAESYIQQFQRAAYGSRKLAAVISGEIDLLRLNYDAAEKHLGDALAIDSTYTGAHKLLGYLFADQGRFAEAESFANLSLSTDSSYQSYNLLAWVLIAGERDIERGILLAQMALSEKPDYYPRMARARPYYALAEHSLGLAYLKKGQYQDAVRYLEQAAQLLPERQAIRGDLELARKNLNVMK
ncbi:MAG: tetratricopeptide repeat protein [Candidatus Marinimicrobia bacterium]|nr:tetratricopeptide repeat protein [Candidatus Neomarinimicrobiota bacterium]